MAEAPESEPLPSPSEIAEVPQPVEIGEPLPKRRKEASEKLEDRLGGILCCAVCLDLPQAAVYQCINGHLMCELCFTHLLADASLRREGATCPNCRVEISKTLASRNLAVEKTVSELPSECKYCTYMFPKHSLRHHEKNICMDRLTECRYVIIGCPWKGAARDVEAHELSCAYPGKPAGDIVEVLRERENQAKEANHVIKHILDLLSYEHITFTNLQLKPYRNAEQSLYYESARFSAFGNQWLVKAFVITSQRDPTQSAQREITYQWVVLREPHAELRLRAAVHAHAFGEDSAEAPRAPLPLADPDDANRLLSNKAIHFRLIMFQA
ncbi:hypothetical protein K1T71_010039 [Dendrolimus kikuchii]|uniref:Uncharacterized protein n=1 Tax=Dendrolimus kikuchii TaxID=765133 RepID=A0ACC1CQP9_9NEOP|nr:hypothetical protein K1T71_010039 [Dendrolimus kikuchii]